MEREITCTPHKWVIVKINNKEYKVFASWEGLEGRWRMNSGIDKVEEDNDFYYFIGYSGSCYKCAKNSYGIVSTYAFDVLNKTIATSKLHAEYIDEPMWQKIVKEEYLKT